MEILSVTLKNFKAHRDRHFTFCPGTNAICGENGAGKTSILEAIAWTLFNYRGSYRKEDLVRNGCRSAQVTVQFISSKDQRTYQIQRCTSQGYTLFDPQLNQRLPYNRIEEEVLPWLREHLGVVAGTDLARLFENTIGVPQGMLTVDFLLSGEKRKRVFDSVLRVEEYKETSKGLGGLQKYAEGQVESLQRDLAHYAEILTQRPDVEARYGQVQQAIQQNKEKLVVLEQQLALLQVQKDDLEAKAKTIQTLEQRIQHLTIQLEGARREQRLRAEAVARSQQALQICNQHRPGYDLYCQAQVALQSLQAQQQKRMSLLQQRQTLDQQRALAEQTLAAVAEKLSQIERAEQAIAILQPAIEQQQQLEVQKQDLDAQQQSLQRWAMERETLSAHLQRLRQDWQQEAQMVKRIEAMEHEVMAIPDLEQQRDQLQSQLSHVGVAKQFEAEFRQMITQVMDQRDRHSPLAQATIEQIQQKIVVDDVSPDLKRILDSALTILTTEGSVITEIINRLQVILTDLTDQASPEQLKRQQQVLKRRLNLAYQQRGEWHQLADHKVRLDQIQAEGAETQAKIDGLTTQLAEQETIQTQLKQVNEVLKTLDDPRQQSQRLQRELSQKPTLLGQQDTLMQQVEQYRATSSHLTEQLCLLENLDTQIEVQERSRQSHHDSYLAYLKYQQNADQLDEAQTKLADSVAMIKKLNAEGATLTIKYEQVSQGYDPQAWQAIDHEYTTVRSQRDQLQGSLPEQQRLLLELETRLAELRATAAKCDRAQVDLTTAQQTRDFVSFARNAYKEAGPRITERYVQVISTEADRLFRELLNRQNVSLEWTREYEIIVQEGPHPRRFVNLSGGEQMCAALAVRLALLRVLADIDIAFFDEPTTNMDQTRRESLAEAIANLRTFRQLFVISHDDTFEQFTEHVILVQRDQA